jgi:tetratricopeptide (TPR) repeat protein
MKRILISVIILLFVFSNITLGQTAKKYFSSAEKFQTAKNYTEAITNYNQAIQMDPNYVKAYIGRAACYELTGKKPEAAEDYKRATVFSPKEKELYYNAGRLYFDIEKYADADAMLKQAIERDKEYQEAIDIRIKTLTKLKNFQEGLAVAELGLNIKKTAISLYNRAVMNDSLKNYPAAEKDYKESKYFDSKFIPSYVGLALVQIKLNKADEALTVCETALTKDANNKDLFSARSQVYAKKGEYQNAVNDMTKVTVADPQNINAFCMRGNYYQNLGQWQNAANDFSKCISMDPKFSPAYTGRAYSYEQANNYAAAIKDYETILKRESTEAVKQLLKAAKDKLYEQNRESNKPEVVLTNPKSEGSNVKIAGTKAEAILKGVVKDASLIKSISVNDVPATYPKDSLNPNFAVKLNLATPKEIVVTAVDVYDNTQKTTFTIQRTETDKPIVALTTPYTSFDNEIGLDNTNPDLYIEGKVKDESIIESIIIDGVAASFPLQSLNPTFSAKITIANKDKITIVVRDIYGNELMQDYRINRDGALASQNNPMGNTWVVFIENTNYQSFPVLEGPAKDVILMKSALANYKVSKIVHKKDMTKNDIEKFFAIELRDLIKNNKINSVLIWYAGHGKFVNQTGYWIPIDAKTDDEFTYFNINNLKASMQSYQNVIHTLVITDACESGPAFYLAMRDAPKERRCENWEETKFKSAQVLSSAGYELAADNSQFTRTFAATLNNNPDGCIAIEKIAEKVATAVKQTAAQAPKLGKISGLEDEGGSFFFMKK